MRGIVASDFHLHACRRDGKDKGLASGRDFARLVDSYLAEGPFELVLCGDIYDLAVGGFDAVEVRLQRIADTHIEFHDALKKVIAAGGKVVFIPGNHDWEMSTEAASAWVTRSLPGARIEPWFWRVHGAHIEHGSQYDPDNAHPHPLQPLGDPLGILLTREIMSRLGDLALLNLNDRTPVVMLAHCFYHYGLKTPGLVLRYCVLGARSCLKPPRLSETFADDMRKREQTFAESRKINKDEVHALAAMTESPTHLAPKRMFRRMYLDRLLLGGVAVVATAATANPYVLLGALLLGGVLGMYRNLYKGKTRDRLKDAALRIARHADAVQVVFGHAHEEHDDGGYINPGSFAFPMGDKRAFVEIDLRGARLRHMRKGGEVLPGGQVAERPLHHRAKHPLYAYARKTLSRRRRGAA